MRNRRNDYLRRAVSYVSGQGFVRVHLELSSHRYTFLLFLNNKNDVPLNSPLLFLLRRNPYLSSLAMYDVVDRPKSIPLLFLFSFFTFEHAPSSDSPPLLVLSLLFFSLLLTPAVSLNLCFFSNHFLPSYLHSARSGRASFSKSIRL